MVKKAKEKNYEVDNDKKIVSAVVVKRRISSSKMLCLFLK